MGADLTGDDLTWGRFDNLFDGFQESDNLNIIRHTAKIEI